MVALEKVNRLESQLREQPAVTKQINEILSGFSLHYAGFPYNTATREEVIDLIVKLPFIIYHAKPFYSCP